MGENNREEKKSSEHGPLLRSAKQKHCVKYNTHICNFALLLNKQEQVTHSSEHM